MDQNKKIPATVRILTLNSGKVLRTCLESVKDFDEILIFDGNSTDNTVEIAKEYGARIEKQFPGRNEPNILIQDWADVVNRVVQAASHDWVFYIDTDETASPGLIQEIREIASDPEIKHYIYRVPNRIIYKGRIIKYSISYPGYQNRFFNRRSGAKYYGSPHYRLVFDEKKYPLGTLKNPWYVYAEDAHTGVKPHFVLLDAIKDKDQTWLEFLRWSVFNKLFGIAKILIKGFFLYARHGFKDTLPPRTELSRVKYKALLFWYLMKQRFIGPLKPAISTPKEYMPQGGEE